MASGDSKRKKKRQAPSDAVLCPSRFVTPARKPRNLPWMPRAGYASELDRDSELLRAAKNYYPEGIVELKVVICFLFIVNKKTN